ncbi:unnamed protein product [Cunninghamella echinulata]
MTPSNKPPLVHHVALNVDDFDKSKQFYTELMALLGRDVALDFPGMYIGYDNCSFGLTKNRTEHPPTPTHLAFSATSNDQVDAFYNKAIALGARCNGKPGLRTEYAPTYYAAFFHDFDGHNIEIVYIGNPDEYNYHDKK